MSGGVPRQQAPDNIPRQQHTSHRSTRGPLGLTRCLGDVAEPFGPYPNPATTYMYGVSMYD